MEIKHHPGDLLLLDYASGALGEGWSLAVATHLALCPTCRQSKTDMEAIGGALLEDQNPATSSGLSFDHIEAQLNLQSDEVVRPTVKRATERTPILPEPLRSYLGADLDAIDWRRLGIGAYHRLVPTEDAATTARLIKIPAGNPVPMHSHQGAELTLVVDGSFTDSTGKYGRGDFQEADETLQHQPEAGPDKDCICLVITDGPLRFKSVAARIAQPFLGI